MRLRSCPAPPVPSVAYVGLRGSNGKPKLPAPQISRWTSRIARSNVRHVWRNFAAYASPINREPRHILVHLQAPQCSVRASNSHSRHLLIVFPLQINVADVNLAVTFRGILASAFKYFSKALIRYLDEYVRCYQCRELTTSLMRSRTPRLDLVVCHTCAATRYVKRLPAKYGLQQHVPQETRLRKIP